MISTASFAQTPAKTPSQSAAPVAAAGDWSASRLSGVNVYNKANDKVGEISDVIIESNGKGTLILEAGDFRGIVMHYVLVSMDSLKFVNKSDKTSAGQTSDTKREWYADRAVMKVTKDLSWTKARRQKTSGHSTAGDPEIATPRSGAIAPPVSSVPETKTPHPRCRRMNDDNLRAGSERALVVVALSAASLVAFTVLLLTAY